MVFMGMPQSLLAWFIIALIGIMVAFAVISSVTDLKIPLILLITGAGK